MANRLDEEEVARRVFELRGRRVLLDRDLALIYQVKTKALRQQVKRNLGRFPADFMLRVSKREAGGLISGGVLPGLRSLGGALPYAFTQEGVAMLSGVLRSPRAIEANIAIMRAFVIYRERIAQMEQLMRRVDELEERFEGKFTVVFDALRRILNSPVRHSKRIGFRP